MRNIILFMMFSTSIIACTSSDYIKKGIVESKSENRKAGISSVQIAKWRNDAIGAYSLIHDDLCATFNDGLFDIAGPLAKKHGVVFGAGAIVKTCLERGGDIWSRIQTLRDQGHEIMSHSWDHGASVDLGWMPLEWNVEEDVIASKQVLEEKLPGLKVDFFIFPYDAYTDERLNELRENAYLGARAGSVMYEDRRVNTRFENFDPFRCEFDAYMSKLEQDMAFADGSQDTISIYDDENDDIDIQHAQAAIDTEGWSLQELHAVSDKIPTAWGAITVENYTRLLKFLQKKQQENGLWVDTPTNVVKYIQTKSFIDKITINGEKIEFHMSKHADQRYETTITLKLEVASSPSGITQSGKAVAFKTNKTGAYLVDVSPFEGALTLSY